MASLPTLSASAASLPRPHVRFRFRKPASSWGCFAAENNGRCGGLLDARLRLRWTSPVRAKLGEADKDKGADLGLRVDRPKTLRRRLRLRPRLRVLRWRLRRLLSPRQLASDAAAALRRTVRRVPLPAAASVVLGALLLVARLTVPKNAAREVAYSDLLAGLRAGAVTAVAFEEDSRRIYFSKAEDVGSGDDDDDERETAGRGAAAAAAAAVKWPYYARRVPHDEGFLLGLMREGGVDYRSAPRPAGRLLVDMLTTLLTLWFSLLPMMWFIQRQMSAAGSADKRRRPRKQQVGFEDVQGVDEAKEELVEVNIVLTHDFFL
jgi:hypothetical protein